MRSVVDVRSRRQNRSTGRVVNRKTRGRIRIPGHYSLHHSNALKTSGRSHRQILRRVRFLLHQNPPSIQARALIQRHGFDGEMLAEAGVPYELLKLLEWGAFI